MQSPLSSVTKPVKPVVPTDASKITFTQKVKNYGATISTSARELIKSIFDKLNALIVEFTDWCKRTFTSVSATDAPVTTPVTPTVPQTTTPVTPVDTTATPVTPVTQPANSVTPTVNPVSPTVNEVTPPVTQPVTSSVIPTVPAQTAPVEESVPQGSGTVAKVARTVAPTLVTTAAAYTGLAIFGAASLPLALTLGLGATAVAGLGVATKAVADNASSYLENRQEIADRKEANAKIKACDVEIARIEKDYEAKKNPETMKNLSSKDRVQHIKDLEVEYKNALDFHKKIKTELEQQLIAHEQTEFELQTINAKIDALDKNYKNADKSNQLVVAKYNLDHKKLVMEQKIKLDEFNKAKASVVYKPLSAGLYDAFSNWNTSNAFYGTAGLAYNPLRIVANYTKMVLTSPTKAPVKEQLPRIEPEGQQQQGAEQQANAVVNVPQVPVEQGYLSKIGTAVWEHPKSALAVASTIATIGIAGPSAVIDTASSVIGGIASAYAFAPITTVVTGAATAVASTQTGRNVISGAYNVVSTVTGGVFGGVNWLLGRNQQQQIDPNAGVNQQQQQQQQIDPNAGVNQQQQQIDPNAGVNQQQQQQNVVPNAVVNQPLPNDPNAVVNQPQQQQNVVPNAVANQQQPNDPNAQNGAV